ncbi:hypothetical protein L1987_21703 [Smallanthus sonchifolius]|uniref:Uncharacterized protein n=1 Tax=Smallanthus sonchifolius TaxID=185202 RepID=A0ACB9IDC6_9ASTR|nr:hypothetical protein L1987_21703 [Smallanthus sonchifolius]
MILWLFNTYDVKWLLVISIVLLSLGTSGDYILQAVLLDLVDNSHDTDTLEHDDETKARSHARAETWSRIVYIAAAISTILWVTPDAVGGFHPSWKSSFLICVIAITTTLIIFCWGHNIYHQGRLTERPGQVVFRVLGERIKKLLKCLGCCMKFSRQDISPKNLRTENIGNEGIPQGRSALRLDTKGKEAEDSQIQYTNLHVSKKIPVQIYGVIQDFSFAIPFLYSWISCLHEKKKAKIGVGMLCGILSCIFPWKLEDYRTYWERAATGMVWGHNQQQSARQVLFGIGICLFGNFILYCCVARYFYTDQDLADNDQEQDNQVSANDGQEQVNQVLAVAVAADVDDVDEKEDNQVSDEDDDDDDDDDE